MQWRRIRQLMKKEFLQALREPRMRTVLILPPIVQTILFGFAVNLDIERARIAWFDQDRTSLTRRLRDHFAGSPYFSLLAFPENDAAVSALLDSGHVQAVIRLLPGFSAGLHRNPQTPLQIIVDGANSNTASLIAAYAAETISTFNAEAFRLRAEERKIRLTLRSGAPLPFAAPSLDFRSRAWFNPNLLSRNYFVPGVVVNIITLVTVVLTAMSIVREKEAGTMEQLLVTPLTPWELLAGKTLPFALIGLAELAFITTLALALFRVPLRGSIPLLVACALLFFMTTLGAGLFISTVSRTQQQAMLTTFLVFFPIVLLSGFAFPIRNMPPPIQWLTYLNPLRYFIEIVRGIFLKGAGAAQLWPQMVALALLGAVIFSLSAWRFRRRLE